MLLENFPEKLFLDKNLWKDVIGKIDFQTNTFDSERKNIISRITKTFLIQPDKLKLQYIEFIKWCKADIYQSHKSMIKEIFKDNAQTDLYEEIMNLVETSRPTLAELLSNKA
ncbi:MAG TPA: hypothetical protein PK765_03915 [bacterium]|nr:hypothetical protein [bacterium]